MTFRKSNSDGISCNEYFLMESGAINISGMGDDGIQCDLDSDASTGETVNNEDEDSGNMYISGNPSGIKEFNKEDIVVRNVNGTILVEGCEDCNMSIFDISSRRISNGGLAPAFISSKSATIPFGKLLSQDNSKR